MISLISSDCPINRNHCLHFISKESGHKRGKTTSSGSHGEEISGLGANPTLQKSQCHVPGRAIASKQVNPALVPLDSGARSTSSPDEEDKGQWGDVTHPRSYGKLMSKLGVKSV